MTFRIAVNSKVKLKACLMIKIVGYFFSLLLEVSVQAYTAARISNAEFLFPRNLAMRKIT